MRKRIINAIEMRLNLQLGDVYESMRSRLPTEPQASQQKTKVHHAKVNKRYTVDQIERKMTPAPTEIARSQQPGRLRTSLLVINDPYIIAEHAH